MAQFKWELQWRCNDEYFEFLTGAGNEHVALAYGKRYLRYFLYEYETALAAKKKAEPKVSWGEIHKVDLHDTIEHILPQTIEGQDPWTERFGKQDGEEHSRLLHDLGNLTLTKWNSHYQNKPFSAKKGGLGPDTPQFCYAKSPFFSEQELTDWNDWTPAAIEERRGRILNWARERWGVDFGTLAAPAVQEEPPDDEQEETPEPLDDEENED